MIGSGESGNLRTKLKHDTVQSVFCCLYSKTLTVYVWAALFFFKFAKRIVIQRHKEGKQHFKVFNNVFIATNIVSTVQARRVLTVVTPSGL